MTTLDHQGVTVELPTGWEGEVYTRPLSGDERSKGFTSDMVLHVGNFPLPGDRGDYGSGAVEIMGSGAVFVALLEWDRASADTVLFAGSGFPTTLDPEDFQPNTLQRPLPGQAGTQVFFNHNGRAFCLYVVLGSYRRRRELVREVNRLLSGIAID